MKLPNKPFIRATVILGLFCLAVAPLSPRLNAIENSWGNEGRMTSAMLPNAPSCAAQVFSASGAEGLAPDATADSATLVSVYSSTNCSGSSLILPWQVAMGLCLIGMIGSFELLPFLGPCVQCVNDAW